MPPSPINCPRSDARCPHLLKNRQKPPGSNAASGQRTLPVSDREQCPFWWVGSDTVLHVACTAVVTARSMCVMQAAAEVLAVCSCGRQWHTATCLVEWHTRRRRSPTVRRLASTTAAVSVLTSTTPISASSSRPARQARVPPSSLAKMRMPNSRKRKDAFTMISNEPAMPVS